MLVAPRLENAVPRFHLSPLILLLFKRMMRAPRSSRCRIRMYFGTEGLGRAHRGDRGVLVPARTTSRSSTSACVGPKKPNPRKIR
jgi:hypothetical protein